MSLKIKSLQWTRFPSLPDFFDAITSIGVYGIGPLDCGHRNFTCGFRGFGGWIGPLEFQYDSIERAKEACETDWKLRIDRLLQESTE